MHPQTGPSQFQNIRSVGAANLRYDIEKLSSTICNALSSDTQKHLILGLHNCSHRQFDKALIDFNAALHAAVQAQSEVEIGKSLNGLSMVYLEIGNYGRSLAYSQAAAAILENTVAQTDCAFAFCQSGKSHFLLDDFAAADRCFGQSLALYSALKDIDGENHVLIHLAQLYAQQKQYMFALACYESVLDSFLDHPAQNNAQELLVTTLSLMMQLCEEIYGEDGVIRASQLLAIQRMPTVRSWQIAQLFRQLSQFQESQQRDSSALPYYLLEPPLLMACGDLEPRLPSFSKNVQFSETDWRCKSHHSTERMRINSISLSTQGETPRAIIKQAAAINPAETTSVWL